MTRSYTHHNADSCPNDFGIPQVLPTRAMWADHAPEWEGWSFAERQEWLDAHKDDDLTPAYFNVDRYQDQKDDQDTNELILNEP